MKQINFSNSISGCCVEISREGAWGNIRETIGMVKAPRRDGDLDGIAAEQMVSRDTLGLC